jgi:hypothetical protein
MNKTQTEHHNDLAKLIDSNPDYQKGGKMRWLAELMGEEMGIDNDHERGVDDGTGVWNMPE